MRGINASLVLSVMTVLVPILMQLFFIRYVSYYVDKEIYGKYVIFQTLVAALSYILIHWPFNAFDRFYNVSINKNKFINEFRTILLLSNGIGTVFIFFYGTLSSNYSFSNVLVLALYFWCLNFFLLEQKILLLNLQRGKYFYLKILESASKFCIPIIFYYLLKSVDGLLLGLFVGYLSLFVIVFGFKKVKFGFELNLKHYKEYFIYAYPYLFISFFSWGISFADRFFIEHYLDSKSVAIYALLAQAAGMGQVFVQIFSVYAYPEILKKYEISKDKALKLLFKSLKVLFCLFAFFTCAAIWLPRDVYFILISPNIINNDSYFLSFIYLMLGIFFTVLQTVLSTYFQLIKRLKILIFIYLFAFIVNLIGNTFIDVYGIVAAAISTFTAYVIIFMLQLWFLLLSSRKKFESH